ncbi:hypothetical protein AX17_004208 [Amanita inopinata Kibby_2008]|nr:hypothetical protein AX17_004208 [Amanita inopinata Kibby_2008]
MPNPNGQEFKMISMPELSPLSLNPDYRANFISSERFTRERLEHILSTVPDGFLQDRELDLLTQVLFSRQKALAFDDKERGTFSPEYFPDYEIPVMEHTPWIQPPIRVPKAIEGEFKRLLLEQKAVGKFEPSMASYRSRIFAVSKKKGLRLVNDVQELNKVTIRDLALPPRPDDFAEKAAGRVIYGLADLFSGYDGRRLAEISRPLTTFGCIIGPHRLMTLPQGATNSVPEFQRCIDHVLEAEEDADAFIDDVSILGPTSDYNNQEVTPGIRKFVYQYATTLDRVLTRFVTAGITASGWKMILATPKLQVVGSVVSKEGWHLAHGVVAKIMKWPEPKNVSEVRSFLGTAGVGRKWIKNFSLIARPLTRLTRVSSQEFRFGEEERESMRLLKELISSTPVLIKIDYEKAKKIGPKPRASDDGLVIVSVDSCQHGSGWVLHQQDQKDLRPAIFGSCTYNPIESRYSQPKAELYGVFRAVKDLRHRVWGLHFQINVDAKFLVEMIQTPDLPNAPMTRWVSFLTLFDFELNYVPAEKHRVPDGLSRRPRAADDSEEEDVEMVLEKLVGMVCRYKTSPQKETRLLPTKLLTALLVELQPIPQTPYGAFITSTKIQDMFLFGSIHGLDLQSAQFEPLLTRSILGLNTKTTGELAYNEEKERRVAETEVHLGNETVWLEVSTWTPATNYSNLCPPRCVVHSFGVKKVETPMGWEEITNYLKNGVIPERYVDSQILYRKFIRETKKFALYEDRLWLLNKNGVPRLVITDTERRKDLVAEAHNEVGHRGRDTTYKLLTDRYFWPNMYDEVAYFVRSCTICQLRSRGKPRVPFEPTWNSELLRRFDLDTVHMETGYGGKHFLLQAIEPSINWPEARAVSHNTSEKWAKFIYKDIICRFGCIPVFVVDNGNEFKGAAEILFKQYEVTAIFTTAYHPEGNAIVERSHQTLCNSLRKSCGKDSSKWPLMLHACLLAMRCTTTRVTGYTPYYLLYGRHPLLSFDIADGTWEFLDWHRVTTTEELVATRAQQLAWREKNLAIALEEQCKSR